MEGLLILMWYVLYIIQSFLGLGTAYRFTKRGGDNGVALFGWLVAFHLVAFVPGLGIYLYYKGKDSDGNQEMKSHISKGN